MLWWYHSVVWKVHGTKRYFAPLIISAASLRTLWEAPLHQTAPWSANPGKQSTPVRIPTDTAQHTGNACPGCHWCTVRRHYSFPCPWYYRWYWLYESSFLMNICKISKFFKPLLSGSFGCHHHTISSAKCQGVSRKNHHIFVVFCSYQDMMETLPKDAALNFTPVVF